jgi:hypothetical protein
MTLDGGWALIISGVLVLFLTGVSVLVWRHVDNAQEDAKKALEEIMALKMEFLRFQTHVAETYARLSGVERMETNIFAVMARFEAKLDTLLESRSAHHG